MAELMKPEGAPVFITEQLELRPPKNTDHLREKLALQNLARSMRSPPEEFLPLFVDLAMDICGGVAAGLSLLEDTPTPGLFRGRYLRGTLASYDGATTPRHHSPSGVALDLLGPILATHPERLYDWIAQTNMTVPEVLVVPLVQDGATPLGTLWVVSDQEGHFDSGHARIATELASFVSIALHMLRSEARLQSALAAQETVAHEMHHRLNNVFTLTDGMIRLTASTARNSAEMADMLSGRLHALARAHQLVHREVRALTDDAPNTSDLESLIRVIVAPHHSLDAAWRFAIDGLPLRCGEQSANSFALIFHELATNAAKYGVLGALTGTVDIFWRVEGKKLVICWQESGGPEILHPPINHGFGSTLICKLVRQFEGSLDYDWRREGLKLTIALPIARFLF